MASTRHDGAANGPDTFQCWCKIKHELQEAIMSGGLPQAIASVIHTKGFPLKSVSLLFYDY